ncbi:unnamed protein product [Cyclocybe aegerita]|uniref:Uncharacterized protein n=1 Tax=Cyclocybe aegerita TaxID=1973307 RepID=A0A8S0W3Q2_CYCAE|nr:unnamed protein product [Cyclocybe aegerita]
MDPQAKTQTSCIGKSFNRRRQGEALAGLLTEINPSWMIYEIANVVQSRRRNLIPFLAPYVNATPPNLDAYSKLARRSSLACSFQPTRIVALSLYDSDATALGSHQPSTISYGNYICTSFDLETPVAETKVVLQVLEPVHVL